ncbi:MAG: Gfo/Idh/MocA family oxidoreductase [Actinomycetota bacterium]|jgi:predicted dehydrogenase|nr:Gfo/Idh/MocA family oxidoreductase [Actinomycetota bacterium]
MKTLGLGMVGYGFIGRVHTISYLDMPFYYSPVPFKIKPVGVCSVPIDDAEKGIGEAGFEFATEDYRQLIERDDIDIIEVCTPNYLHKDIIIEALEAGKHVVCEKPLAMNLDEARQILEAAKQHPGQVAQVSFEYRYQPAVMRARQLIQEGFLGRIYSSRIVYLHAGNADPNRPAYWKIQKEFCGGGSLYDLGSHIIDITRFLLGDFKKVFSKLDIFVKERPIGGNTEGVCRVDTEDLALMLFELENGVSGTLEASKVANGTNDEIRFEIHGDKGAIRFNSMQPNYLEVYDNRNQGEPIGGFRGFTAIETVQRYPKPATQFPGPKFAIGWIRYHMGSAFDFLNNIAQNQQPEADMYAGYKVQEVMEAAMISNSRNTWVDLPLRGDE